MIRMQDKIQPDYYIEIRDLYRQEQEVRQQVVFYAEALRALRNVESVQK